MKKLVRISALLLIAFWGMNTLHAQRLMITTNFSHFNIDKPTGVPGVDVNYTGVTDLTANVRLLSRDKWAIRVGAGVESLQYNVSGTDISTNYTARRQDIKGLLGLEKHFVIANSLDIYPGVYVPLIITGDDIINQNYDNIENGGLRAGLGVVLGANLKMFKILRIGVELDATYDNFQQAVWEGVDQKSFAPIKGMQYQPNFTLGLAF
ncbi:MAG: hypothetical protein OHK0039_17620 [Bacteroidia bacterium]